VIARVWRGATRAGDADAYAAYLEQTGMERARALAGSRGTLVLRRLDGDRALFETILLFDSLEDVRSFAGDELEAAVFFPKDDEFLVERELSVAHYEVDARLGQGPESG
jgi:antibiotic biosynthesis monooxygenase (ABM) superfamily enzyme